MTVVAERTDVTAAGNNPGRGVLRVMTCGSVDDGKSTLIGRLLFEQNKVYDDHLAAAERDSKRHGTTGDDIDLALLVDGLEAEREQGITIDVAYRYVSTADRSFIIADAPGHEQYTRNMATAASVSDVAILLIDARKGVLPQTRRHAIIAALFGIRHVVLAINKMDLVGFRQDVFDRVAGDFLSFAVPLEFSSITPIPIAARQGDNIAGPSGNTAWYAGTTLLDHLNTLDTEADRTEAPFRFVVQWVNRPDADFRGYSGFVASGSVNPGDRVSVARSGAVARVDRLVTMDGDREHAVAGDAVTITLAEEIDVSRGDTLSLADARPAVADQFQVKLLWLASDPLLPGRSYLMKAGAHTVQASVSELKSRTDITTLGADAAKTLELNEMGIANVSLADPIAFDPFDENRETGSFILIDRYTNETVAAGMINFALWRSTNVHWQALDIDKAARGKALGQRPALLWFTGLSGAGKSTVANIVEKKLHARGRHTYLLDGDNVRHGLNRDLGFSDADRVENIRRVGEVARLFVDAGIIVLASFISPFRSERRMARELLGDAEFLEVFVDASVEKCTERDPKGLYARAIKGEIKNFTGVSSPYEAPENPELHINTEELSAEQAADRVIEYLEKQGMI